VLNNHFSDSTIKSDILNLLCTIAETGNEADKCHIAQTFSSIKWQDEQIINTLEQMVIDKDVDVCIDAMQALGSIGAKNSIETITKSLIHDPEGDVKQAAVDALGNIGGNKVIDTLCEIALNRPKDMEDMNEDWDIWWDIQRQAIQGLSHLDDPKAVKTLMEILEDKDEIYQDLESELFKALVLTGEQGEEEVLQQLKTGKELNRRRAAIALSYSKNKKSIKALGRALLDKSADVKTNAVDSLLKRNAKQYRPAIELLVRDDNPNVKHVALAALGRLGLDSESLKDPAKILQYLKSESIYLINTTLNYLQSNQEHVDENIEKQMLSLLNHANAEVCTTAIKTVDTDNEDINQLIINIINNNDSVMMVRIAAIHAAKVENKQDAKSFTCLLNFIENENTALRYATLSKLVQVALASDDKANEDNLALTTVLGIANGTWVKPEPENKYKTIPIYPETVDTTQTTSETVQKTAPLPDPVKEEDLASEGGGIVSTLDAISQSNTLNMLDSKVEENTEAVITPNETVEELQEFESIVAQNAHVADTRLMKEAIPFATQLRQDMIQLLSDYPTEEVVKSLIASLSDEKQTIRAASALSIANLALNDKLHEQVINAFGGLMMILETGEHESKQYAIRALSNLGNKGAMGRIAEFVVDTKEAVEIRNEALLALSNLLINAKDPKKTDHMVFDHMGTTDVIDTILTGYKGNESTLRGSALRALSDIAKLDLDVSIRRNIVNTIFENLYEMYDHSLKQVASVLTAFDPMLSSEKLIETLKTQDDMGIRKIALHVLTDMLNNQQIH
jgi:HEAT repeat protein